MSYKCKTEKPERDSKIVEMLKQEISVADVAKEFGVSRQTVNRIKIKYSVWRSADNRSMKTVKNIIYPNIRKFLIESNMSLPYLCTKIGENPEYNAPISSFLMGKTAKITIQQIKRILETTNMPFETAFYIGGNENDE